MKKKFWSKAMALLMTLCMVISMCPLTAFAAEPENSSGSPVATQAADTIEIGETTYTKLSLTDDNVLTFWGFTDDDTEIFLPTGPTYWQAGDSADNYILYVPHSDGTPDEIIMHNATINAMLPGSSNSSCTITLEGDNYIKGTFATHSHNTRNWKITGDSAATLHISDSLYSFQITKGTLTIDRVKVYSNTQDALWADSGLFLTNGALLDVTVTNSDAYGLYFTFPNNGDCLSVTGGSTLNIHAAGSDTIGILEGNLGNDISSFGILISDNSTVSIDGDMALYAMNSPCNMRISNSTFTANGTYLGLYAKEDSTLSLENSTFTVTGNKAINSKLAVSLNYNPCRIVTAGETADTAVEVSAPDAATYSSKYVKVKPADAHIYGEWTPVEGNSSREARVCTRCGHTEYRDAGTITLQSDNVTVASATGEVTLTQSGDGTTMWQNDSFTFSVTPAEGYATTSDFAVKYDNGDGNLQTLTENNGFYTVKVESSNVNLYVYGIERQYTVTFAANGDSSVDPQQMFTDSFVAKPDDPTREGYNFAGWYRDADGKTAWNFGTDTVTEDITLYAKWIPAATAVYTVSGMVTGNDGEDLSGTVVKLMQGNSVIAAATTDADGKFAFANLPAGSYNISAEKDDRGTTVMVSVADNSSVELKLPAGNIKTEVNVDENTPNTCVSGLDALAEDSEYKPTGSEVVRIVLNVAGKEESDIQTEADKIKELSGSETLSYLDMNIERYVNGAKQSNITNTGNHVQAITVDFDTARKNISVYRVHRDETGKEETSKLTAAGSTPADGTYRVNDGSITIYATKFSTYAIGYTVKSSGSHSSGGSAAATYPVTVKSVTNGSVKADKASASAGSTVTITVTPDKGYELNKLTVTDKDGKTVSVTAKGSGQYTFAMPAGSVTVAASFSETDWDLAYRDCPKDNTCPIWPFTDAKPTDWYHDGVHFCLENKLMVGYGANTFKPDNSTSRAMLTVMLWRLSGSPTVNYAMPFSDVDSGKWYTEAVRWAASSKVVTGFTDDTFRPDAAVTREQMAAVLYRYAQSKDYDVSVGENTNILSYADAESVSAYAIPAMQWACGSGMIQGTNGSLNPKNSTTRAQMATMMMRFCAEIVK